MIKGITLKICMLCSVLMHSIILNLYVFGSEFLLSKRNPVTLVVLLVVLLDSFGQNGVKPLSSVGETRQFRDCASEPCPWFAKPSQFRNGTEL